MDETKRVLIVEDNPDLLEALEESFRHAGFEVFAASNGHAGMEMALQYHPDIVLLDLLLPQIEGLPMLKRLRGYDWGKGVPVIVLTNFDDPDSIRKANELGVTDYLVKANYKLADVVKRVKNYLYTGK